MYVYRSGKTGLHVRVDGETISNGWKRGVDEELCHEYAKAVIRAHEDGKPAPKPPPSGARTTEIDVVTVEDLVWAHLEHKKRQRSVGAAYYSDLVAYAENHILSDFDGWTRGTEKARSRKAWPGEDQNRKFEPFSDVDAAKLNRQTVQQWVDHLVHKRGLHEKTVNTIVNLLRQAYDHAALDHPTLPNPVRGIAIPEQLDPNRKPQYADPRGIFVPEPEQLWEVVRHLPPRLWLSFWFCLIMGHRISEAHGVRMRDLDRDKGKLLSRHQHGSSGGYIVFGDDGELTTVESVDRTKSRKPPVWVPPILLRFLDWHIDQFHDEVPSPDTYICRSPGGGPPDNKAFRTALAQALYEAGLAPWKEYPQNADIERWEDAEIGLPFKVTPHTLRKFAGGVLAGLPGVGGRERSLFLGHRVADEGAARITTSTYTPRDDRKLMELAETYDGYLRDVFGDTLVVPEDERDEVATERPAREDVDWSDPRAVKDHVPDGSTTVEAAAELAGVTPSAVYHQVRTGNLETLSAPRGLNRKYLVTTDSVDKWIQHRESVGVGGRRPPRPPEGWITAAQAAESLEIKPSSLTNKLRSERSQGELVAKKIRGFWYVQQDSLQSELQRRRSS